MNRRGKELLLWFVAGVVISLIIIFLVIRFFELPIKEGTVVRMQHDSEHVTFREDRKSVYRRQYYTDSDGDRVSRRVFDHFEYCIEKHFDGEDWFIVIQQPSKKIKDKILERTIYVKPFIYARLGVGDWFVYCEENGDHFWERNNNYERVTEWSRYHQDVTPYKSEEY
jgi:hypothetical protein